MKARARRCVLSGALLVPAWAGLLSSCSGPAFDLATAPAAADPVDGGGSLPPLVTRSTPDAGAPPPPEVDAATPPPEPPPPPTGPCGELRDGDPALADGEVCIEAGQFVMGSDAPALGTGFVIHSPSHPVTLGAFAIDLHEVTVARYRACVNAAACATPAGVIEQGCTYSAVSGVRDRHPMTCLTWQEAQDFCRWDGGRSLPTEAQWERAARGSASATYPWGEGFECRHAIVAGASQCREHAGVAPQPVGSAPAGASAEGVMDLVGNASEWVRDWFAAYRADGGVDPMGPSSGSARVLRGGGWLTPAADAVAYARRAESPEASGSFSFRCARVP